VTRRRSLPDPAAALAWTSFALQAAETLLLSMQVIGHRTQRRNTPAQLFDMGNEKVQAAMEASHAMTRHWVAMNRSAALGSWSEWPRLFASGLAPFRHRVRKNARRAARRW
jgi:hypothetical protein